MPSTITHAIAAIAIALAASQATVTGQGGAPERSLGGVWLVKITESAGTLVLAESGDEFTTDASTTVFDVHGNPVGTGGCSNAVGTRFKLEL